MVGIAQLAKCFCWFQGAITHQDFAGHKGTIGPGDVQVTTLINDSDSKAIPKRRRLIGIW